MKQGLQYLKPLPSCQKESLVVCTHIVRSHMKEVMLSRLGLASRNGSDTLHAWPMLAQDTAAGKKLHTITMLAQE